MPEFWIPKREILRRRIKQEEEEIERRNPPPPPEPPWIPQTVWEDYKRRIGILPPSEAAEMPREMMGKPFASLVTRPWWEKEAEPSELAQPPWIPQVAPYERWQAPPGVKGTLETMGEAPLYLAFPQTILDVVLGKGLQAGMGALAKGGKGTARLVTQELPRKFKLMGDELKNKLPHQTREFREAMTELGEMASPLLKQRQWKKQIQATAEELAEHLGQPVTKVRKFPTASRQMLTKEELSQALGAEAPQMFTEAPITKQALKQKPLLMYKGKIQDFTERTYRVERILGDMDRGVEGGKMQQAMWEPVNEASTQVIRSTGAFYEGLKTFIRQQGMNIGKLYTDKITTQGVTLSSTERIGVYLHSLNSHNRLYLQYRNNLPDVTINAIVESLTPQERALADFIGQGIKNEGPLVDTIMKQVTGKGLKFVRYYFPIQTERAGLLTGEYDYALLVKDEQKLRYALRWASSQIGKRFTIPRTAKIGPPIKLDALDILLSHMQGVQHYKAFAPVIKDLQALMAQPALRNAIIKRRSTATYEVLDQWLRDVAKSNPLRANNAAEVVLRNLRVNTVGAVLGMNLVTALKQFPSFVSGAAEIGEAALVKGLLTYVRHPKDTAKLIKELSPQIHARTFERELAEARFAKGAVRKIQGKLSPQEIFMWMTSSMDKLAVSSIWRGAYDDALRHGLTRTSAAKYAERAIRKTQPYFNIKDVPEFWRSGEFAKALTIFSNQLNQYWNYYRFDIWGKMRYGQISKPEAMRRIMEAFVIPALMIGAISRSRIPQDAKEVGRDIAGMGAATIPILGNLVSSAIQGYQYGGLITAELMERIQRLAYNANKGEWDKVGLGAAEAGGIAVGVPVGQPKRTIKAVWDLAQQNTDDWLELIWGEYVRDKATKEELKPRGLSPMVPLKGREQRGTKPMVPLK